MSVGLKIKPLSVNEAWKGRRFKTDKYKAYRKEVLLMLPKLTLPEGPLYIYLEWGFSNSACDFDNPIKPFVDILQEKYGFNDNRIIESHIKKTKVKKGAEYILFNLEGASHP